MEKECVNWRAQEYNVFTSDGMGWYGPASKSYTYCHEKIGGLKGLTQSWMSFLTNCLMI